MVNIFKLTAVLAITCIIFSACSKPDTPAKTKVLDTDTEQQPGASIAGDQPPAKEEPPTPYPEGEVAAEKIDGSAKFDTIKSESPCRSAENCTSTKFENAPKSAEECTCQAACTPFVVNKQEAERRRVSNERHCGPSDWFGPKCPAPECRFNDFDSFKCIDGKCVGLAEGRSS